MSRLFGWDLPPGVSSRDIDRAAGVDGPCAVCWKDVDACICPECPSCGAHGDPGCYAEGGHGLTLSEAQIDAAAAGEQAAADEAGAAVDAAEAERAFWLDEATRDREE